MVKHETKVKENLMFEGRIFSVRSDDVTGTTGRAEKREVVFHNGGVGVVPIDKEEVILIRQYRYAIDKETLEIPAGKLEKNEAHINCGIRELGEEAGCSGDMIYLTGMHSAVGFSNEVTHIYMAQNLKFFDAHPDEGEEVETVRLPIETALKMIDSGDITDSKTIVGILLADRRRKTK